MCQHRDHVTPLHRDHVTPLHRDHVTPLHRDHAAFLLISATLLRETPKTEAHAMYVMS